MTPASLDELLKEWEADAREGKQWNQDLEFRERILSLIAVVRKQNEALKKVSVSLASPSSSEFIGMRIEQAHWELQKICDFAISEAERILQVDPKGVLKG